MSPSAPIDCRRHRDRRAGVVDDGGVGVGQDLAQRLVGVGRAGRGSRRVDPGDRLLVDGARLVVADGPVEEVLERSGQGTGVLRRAEHHGVGGSDGCSQLGDRRRERPLVAVGVEVRETVEALVEDGDDSGREPDGGPSAAVRCWWSRDAGCPIPAGRGTVRFTRSRYRWPPVVCALPWARRAPTTRARHRASLQQCVTARGSGLGDRPWVSQADRPWMMNCTVSAAACSLAWGAGSSARTAMAP